VAKKKLTYTVLLLAGLFIGFILFDIVFPFKVKEDYSQIVVATDGSILHAFLNKEDKWRMKIDVEEINPLLKKTIIFKEDKYFMYHFGINPLAVLRALFVNIIQRERVSGASTITMQVARLLEPKERTYLNKTKEMFRALQLEFNYSKSEILQLYLNLVSYGGNIEGVKSASVLYFQQMPQALSLAQVVTLAIIPNRPTSLRLGRNNSFIIQERNKWLEYFKKASLFTEDEIADALEEPLVAERHEAPKLAPHFSLQLKKLYPGINTIKTFLDPEIQEMIENLTYNYIRPLKVMNITNAAVIVVNNRTNAIEAYLGSADFYDYKSHGQVDGAIAVRSPGSTLKPYLYALAIDKGLVTPHFILSDLPVNYGGYRPDNYDAKFRGLITMEDALALSLNVPAVNLLNEIDVNYFIEKLGSADFGSIKNNSANLGLSVILGGCGVKLTELTDLFRAFANQGIFSKMKWTKEDYVTGYDTLFTSAASYMITEVLTIAERPDLPAKYGNSIHLPRIAWKTGTSYGRRDAWSIGYNMEYTIGVWVGNFPGIGVPEMNGASHAAPLLFKIFNNIDYDGKAEWFMQPDEMDYRLVCSESGLPPRDFCDNLVMDAYIPGISPSQKCQHMKAVFLSPDRKKSFCRSCLPEAGYRKELMQNLSPEIITFYEENNIPYTKIPPHNQKCLRVFEDNAPVITSLNEGIEYILMKDEEQQLMLSCSAENDVNLVYWYIDDKFFKSSPASQKIFFNPKAGEIKISCTDDKGRNSDIWIQVTIL